MKCIKYMYICFNLVLITIIGIFVCVQSDHNTITTDVAQKSLNTVFIHQPVVATVPLQEVPVENVVEEVVQNVQEEVVDNVAPASVAAPASGDALETQVGKLSSYGPDCAGCSGHVATGMDVTNGNITYNDPTYGVVRIVAGDRNYPFGTIVRITTPALGTFNAIVLDRGGDIGFGRRFLFDLLCPSEAEGSGSHYDVTFEILRYGY